MSDINKEALERYASDYRRRRSQQPRPTQTATAHVHGPTVGRPVGGPADRGHHMHNRESLADTWKTALVVITGVLAFLVFVGGGFLFAPENYWGETGFNFWAGIGAAIAVSLPLLPWIGLFHIFSKKPAASGIH